MEASFYPYLGALCWIGMLLMLGTLIRAKVPLFQKLQREGEASSGSC